jgi:hypothetical protein
MCGGGGGQSEQLAVQSAQQEQARQDRINQGMREIELMFKGGRRPTGQVGMGAKYDPNQTYYDKKGGEWRPQDTSAYRATRGLGPAAAAYTTPAQMSGSGDQTQYTPAAPMASTVEQPYDPRSRFMYGLQHGDKSYDQALADETATRQQALDDETNGMQFAEAMQGGLYTGAEDAQGYGPEFFDKAYKAQLDYAMPQVDRQYADAQKSLEFALARQGLSASSQAGQLQGDLARQRELAVQGEHDKANTVRQQQMSAVEDERSSLTQMLQQTGDVQSTMNAAAARKNIIDAAPAIQEVAPLFQNATGALADMIVTPSMRAASARGTGGGYGSGKGSGKVVG